MTRLTACVETAGSPHLPSFAMFFRRRNQKPSTPEEIACDQVKQSDLFDVTWYLDKYPDVAQAGFDPALHYLRHGAAEGRNPGPWFDTNAYIEAFSNGVVDRNPLLHYLEHRGNSVTDASRKEKRPYSNFADFLRFTATDPLVRAPFQEEDRRCFAVMESIRRYLAQTGCAKSDVKVSIIMPVWNRAATLPTAIDSVLAQNYTNFELIIIDDGSDDQSGHIAELAAANDLRIRFYKLDTQQGVCTARNFGLAQAAGDLIAYLDSDNSWLDDYLGAAVGAFELLPSADAIFSGQYIYAERNLNKLSAIRFGPMNRSLLEQHNYIDLNCFVHRRTVSDSGVGFDPELKRLVDWDFILRIGDRHRIVSVPVLLSRYYLEAADNTITKTASLDIAVEKITSTRKLVPCSTDGLTLGKKVCIIVVSFEAISFLRECVESLDTYIGNDQVELVIVDNNSSEEVIEYLRHLEQSPGVKIIFNKTNFGFSYAVNQGVSAASADADVLLLNNDARLEKNCVEILQKTAYQSSDIAITVPQQVCPAGTGDIGTHVPYATPGLPCDVSLSSHHDNIESIEVFHDGRQVELNFAPFFCVYIKRAIWNSCGGLDYVNGRHYRSDRIMCDYVRHVLRQRVVYTPAAIAYHAVQAATKELESRDDSQKNDYRQMLINNIWPDDLMRELGIKNRPWHAD